ncbi:MAG: VWA domain-containing protein [Acutalibacteraceae bacterium]
MSIETLGPEDFGRGTRKRLPICFCLDVSGSMCGERMVKLNQALQVFVNAAKDNPETASSADVAVVTFGGYPEILKPMSQLSTSTIPVIEARERSLTPMGEAIKIALKILEIRKNGYRDRGLKYFQPWLVLITDGKPEGKNAEEEMESALEKLNELERNHKIVVFNIGIDNEVDTDMLRRVSVLRPKPISIESDDLSTLFQFLGSSSAQVIDGHMGTDSLYKEIVDPESREAVSQKSIKIDLDAYGDI